MTRWRAVALCLLAAAAPNPAPAPVGPSPAALAAELASKGARDTVRRLWDSRQYEDVLARIGNGADAWVALAPKLAPGTDAASAEGLTIALATALPRNPASVLRATDASDGPTGTKRVCSAPFIEPTAAEIASYTAVAQAALTTVTESDLVSSREACAAALRG